MTSKERITIDRIKAEILEQANEAWEKCQRTNDYTSFGKELENLYRSYGLGTTLPYSTAMAEIIAGKVPAGLNENILDGNYGLRVQASVVALDHMKEHKDIQAKVGAHAAKTYKAGLNPCELTAIGLVNERQKQAKKGLNSVNEVVFNSITFM